MPPHHTTFYTIKSYWVLGLQINVIFKSWTFLYCKYCKSFLNHLRNYCNNLNFDDFNHQNIETSWIQACWGGSMDCAWATGWNVTSRMKKKPELVRAKYRYGQAKWSLGLSLSVGHEAILTNHKWSSSTVYSGDGVPLTEDVVMHSKEYFNSYDIEEARSVDKGTTWPSQGLRSLRHFNSSLVAGPLRWIRFALSTSSILIVLACLG